MNSLRGMISTFWRQPPVELGWSCIKRNSSSKQTEEAVKQGLRLATEELLTIMAHDLRNYLTPLNTHLDLLKRRAQRNTSPKTYTTSKWQLPHWLAWINSSAVYSMWHVLIRVSFCYTYSPLTLWICSPRQFRSSYAGLRRHQRNPVHPFVTYGSGTTWKHRLSYSS